ncbi:hypothetical protein HPB51_004517 [Rhipicephalus microplus]|uniref:THAP-type domain-containing protein n=1 Tax=Rhipicephalus microplus TaxID=6941 RepID=A0A9J6ELD5_RHIMP|nr:hypothetical protein HPB51_013123 [Rhipicephalus microplus]KAH8019375.1 hypothetical protein HPB51_019332 [Rhipicephalus microplus]KAH8019761.1 hypothetical protein HPB51_021796 [Rhipicephalus microplus]KAH8019762.1 hypothetical protein HPB51_021797 [Rhipicephalus microplus]KAH8022922.1 hypothetical protein HPB51_006352 [Rhipicephalus microplus]
MPRCAVPGCRSGYSSATSNEVPFVQRHFFKPPKDPNVLREWNNAAGRANFEVTQRSYICDRHFDEADICTSFQHVVNGETVSIPRGRWELKKGAVPRHFANCAELDLKLCVENVGTNAASVLVAEDDITPVLQSESETCTEMLEHENRAASNAESMEVIMKESSTAPGHVLAKIVLDAIVQLRKHNAIVVAVISDGASTNKAMWSNFGISGKLHTANHKVQHPCEPNQSLYFLCDVPHIVKCIRNHLLRHKYGMIGEHRINYDHYRVLQEVDGKEQLRIVPKLTAEHVCPDNMRKMSVKLAVQIIQDFMIILDLTERNHVEKGTAMFASQVTMESLRVTLSSILELTNDLLAKGARYVLTGKLNQDPLERFFGITRSFGGDEDHPTILSFSHIYRLLSLYTPVKASIAGNVQEEPTLILATVQETMKQGKKQQLATYEKLRETISAKISEVCLPGISSASHSGPTPLPDHGYALPAVQECVVYYLCGYIVHSFLKHVNCAACISSIQSTNTKFPASLLTLAREFRNGSLKHPSTELYTMLKRVEEKLSLVLGENHLCADMFWDALDVIKDCDVPSVGCSVHKDILTSEIVHSYVVLRMHFFTRDVCKKLSASGRVSSTKKKAKLL